MSRNPIDKTVTILSAVCCLAFVFMTIASPDQVKTLFDNIFKFFITNFGWTYMACVAGFVVFCLTVAFSRYGNVRLGKDDEKTGIQPQNLVRHAVRRRHGHRIGVLGSGRTHLPFRRSALCRTPNRRGRLGSHAYGCFPLGAASLGLLCHRGACACLFSVPQGLSRPDQCNPDPIDRRASCPGDLWKKSSIAWQWSPPCSAWPHRWGWGRFRSPPA